MSAKAVPRRGRGMDVARGTFILAEWQSPPLLKLPRRLLKRQRRRWLIW